MDSPDESRLESYLVRLWRDSRCGPWRASAQNIRTRAMAYFARPEQLWAYLQAEMAEIRSDNPADDCMLEKKAKESES